MTGLQHLPASEARKLLALAAVAVKARERPPGVPAVIETHGSAISPEEVPALIRVITHRLLDRKRLTRGLADAGDHGPAVFDLGDLRADVSSARGLPAPLGGLELRG